MGRSRQYDRSVDEHLNQMHTWTSVDIAELIDSGMLFSWPFECAKGWGYDRLCRRTEINRERDKNARSIDGRV